MPFYYTPYIILPLLSALVNGWLATHARRRHVPGAGWLFWLLVAFSGWSLSYALNTAATELWLKNLLFKLGGGFVCLCIFALLPMVIALIKGEESISRVRLALLAIVPCLSFLMIWTNDLHGLIRYDLHLVHKGGAVLFGYQDGLYYRYVHIVYVYLYSLATVLLCLREAFRPGQPRRSSLLLIIAAVMTPFAVDLFDLTAVREMRLTTSALFLSGICYWFAIFRHQLLNLVPIARSALFEQMQEPVLIIDSQGRLAETNEAARSLLQIPADAEGAQLGKLFPAGGPLERLVTAEHGETLHDAQSGCWWHISRTMTHHGDVGLGSILVLRDVTERQKVLERLAGSLASEREARNEQERFLDMISHEYRTPLAIIQTNIDLLGMQEATVHDRQSGQLGKMQRAVERLVDIFETARRRKSLDPRRLNIELECIDFKECLEETVKAARDFWGDRFVFENGPPGSRLLADRHLLKTAIMNLLDNAVKYSPPGEPVGLRLSHSLDSLSLEIRNRSVRPLSTETSALFRKYSRGANSAGTSGTGVGLYLVAGIIEQHNGTLAFNVHEQCEVTVTLTLPFGVEGRGTDDD